MYLKLGSELRQTVQPPQIPSVLSSPSRSKRGNGSREGEDVEGGTLHSAYPHPNKRQGCLFVYALSPSLSPESQVSRHIDCLKRHDSVRYTPVSFPLYHVLRFHRLDAPPPPLGANQIGGRFLVLRTLAGATEAGLGV